MDAVRNELSPDNFSLSQHSLPIGRKINQPQTVSESRFPVHLLIIGNPGPFFEMYAGWPIHHHQDDFALRIGLADQRNHLLQIIACGCNGSLIVEKGVVHRELDEHDVRMTTDYSPLKVLNPPL